MTGKVRQNTRRKTIHVLCQTKIKSKIKLKKYKIIRLLLDKSKTNYPYTLYNLKTNYIVEGNLKIVLVLGN